MPTQPTMISKAQSLANFRLSNSAQAVLEQLDQSKNVLIDWQVGVGKSFNMDQVTELALSSDKYDLVIVMAPTRNILAERKFLQQPPSDIKVVNIQPRPVKSCGKSRNDAWLSFERRNLAHLGKKYCCQLCPKYQTCFWPIQYGKNLKGAKVIFATQKHLENNPYFIPHLKDKSGAEKVLVIFDEANVSLSHYSRTICAMSLKQMLEVMEECNLPKERVNEIKLFLSCMLNASTSDLQDNSTWHFPRLSAPDMTQLLTIGDTLFGDEFYNIIYDLQAFGYSDVESREKIPDGSVRFPASPFTAGCHVLLYSGTTHPKILKMKLGLEFSTPYADYTFRGENTTWLNIASSIGTMTNFRKNSPQILDVFLQLTIQRIRLGKRVLLVSKKNHVDHCITLMNQMLVEQQINDIRIVHAQAYVQDEEIHLIPVIHYGVIGINQFEHFDCCYCLNSYYVTKQTLSDSIQSLRSQEERIDLSIAISDNPKRRMGMITDDKYRFSDVAEVANPMLQILEMGVVVQAIGRVRPFTKSREIITFQNNDCPDMDYDVEFSNLASLRTHFGLETHQKRHRTSMANEVHALIAQGKSQKDIAASLGISSRTVRRYKSLSI